MDLAVEYQIKNAFENPSDGSVLLSSFMLGVEASFVIARWIRNRNHFQELNLSYNVLGPAGTSILAEALSENWRLTNLDLSINRMQSGVYVLADSLKSNRAINRLNVSCNQIRESGLLYLINSVSERAGELAIDMSQNEITFRVRDAARHAASVRPDLTLILDHHLERGR